VGMSEEIIWRSPPEKSSWQRRAEWYEKENHRLVKSLLRIRDLMIGLDQTTAGRKTINLIDSLNIESGWVEGIEGNEGQSEDV